VNYRDGRSQEEYERITAAHERAIGKIVVAWNEYQEQLGKLFGNLFNRRDWSLALAVWHAHDSDRAQRKMLLAAARAKLKPKNPLLTEIEWLINNSDKIADHDVADVARLDEPQPLAGLGLDVPRVVPPLNLTLEIADVMNIVPGDRHLVVVQSDEAFKVFTHFVIVDLFAIKRRYTHFTFRRKEFFGAIHNALRLRIRSLLAADDGYILAQVAHFFQSERVNCLLAGRTDVGSLCRCTCGEYDEENDGIYILKHGVYF